MDFAFLELVPDSMVVVDAEDGRIVHMNSLAEKLFGWQLAEAIGQPVEILIPARFRESHRADRRAYSGAPRVRPMALGRDLSGLRKGGKQFPAEISLAPMQRDGKVFVIAGVRDVTERKEIERRAQLYEKARDDVRVRDEFLTIASHEFKTPISALAMQAQMLLKAMERSGDPALSRHRSRVMSIHRQTLRLSRLVQGLLDITQITAGRLVLSPERVDLAAVVRDAAERWKETLARANCELRMRVPQAIPGYWDRMRLEQIIDNLVANAAKFGAGKPVEVAADADETTVRIVVRDEGIGIAPEDQERIFGRFERAAPTRYYGGFGLGLWIVRNIVEAHGGEIHVSSHPGHGSTFDVMLPREASAA